MAEYDQSIVLIGFMGAGKSSVGRRLEERLGFPRFDTDELVAAEFGLTISRIFELRGESEFRDAEDAMLRRLKPDRASIIVTGGGILLRSENGPLVRQLGFIVYLRADEETLFKRVSKRALRPLLRGDDPRGKMKALLKVRAPIYERYADAIVETANRTHDEVTELILKKNGRPSR